MKEAIELVEKTFRDLPQIIQPPKTYLILPKGDLRMMPAYIPDLGIFGVKLVTVFPENSELPAVLSQTLLFDDNSGALIETIPSTELTAIRTGATGAVAAKWLCDKERVKVSIFGLGVQGHYLIKALKEVKQIETIFAFDLDESKRRKFRDEFDSVVIDTPPKLACQQSDIIITATPSTEPIVWKEWVPEECLILAMGADAPGKQELDLEILTNAIIICDSIEQAIHSGEINVAISLKIKLNIAAELSQIVSGYFEFDKKGKTIVFDSTGIAALDVAIADHQRKKSVKNSAGSYIIGWRDRKEE